ncbi:MAG: ABC transporter permease [Clostridiales bacterium]|jgi:peptide/nickel transport system permease protein|nr:ABC transporter permease [Clostridiales bacterium]
MEKPSLLGCNAVIRYIKGVWGQLGLFGKISLIILLNLVLMAVFAPYLTRHPHHVSSGPPLVPPGAGHLLGTDDLGVDLWSMICFGARVSLMVGLFTALLAGLGGGIAGIIAAYRGGWPDRVLMRIVDIMVVLPDLPVMIVLAVFFGSSLHNIIIVLALFSWSMPARLIRSQALALKEQAYIKIAAHYGAGMGHLFFRHFLPELFPLMMVSMIRLAGMAIVTEASLSFLGLGDPTSRSWGLIINHAVSFRGIYFTPFWKWWLVYPWIFLTLLVSSLALLGRDLEGIADPRIMK